MMMEGRHHFRTIKALLFDLGGVVIDIDFNRIFSRWAEFSGKSAQDTKSGYVLDRFYEAHERGEISAGEYFDSLRRSLGIDLSDSQFEEGWNAIFKGEIPGIHDLLTRAAEKAPVFAFSNSNPIHHQVWASRFSNVLSLFQSVFVSSEIKRRKPDLAAFRFVADAMGAAPGEIVFYDDSIDNIEGAEKAGFNTVHVRSIQDIERSLFDYEIINPI